MPSTRGNVDRTSTEKRESRDEVLRRSILPGSLVKPTANLCLHLLLPKSTDRVFVCRAHPHGDRKRPGRKSGMLPIPSQPKRGAGSASARDRRWPTIASQLQSSTLSNTAKLQ